MRSINDFPMIGVHTPASSTYNITLADIGTYYSVYDSSQVVSVLKYFTAVSGLLTYNFTQKMFLRFVGDTGISVDKASTITFTLFKNGIPELSTKLGFVNPTKLGAMGVNGLCEVSQGDTIEIKATSDTIDTILTIDSLEFSFK